MQLSRSERKFSELQRAQERETRRQIIRIVNPTPGGKTHLKCETAYAHCERGAAEWRDNGRAIEFVGHKLRSALKGIEADQAVHAHMGSPTQRIPVVRMRELFAPSPRRNFAWEKAVDRSTKPVIGPFGETAAERKERAKQAFQAAKCVETVQEQHQRYVQQVGSAKEFKVLSSH